MLAADTIAINRIKISGDKRNSQLLVREIQHRSWSLPLPRHLQQAWIFVRQLEVHGRAQDLRQLTERELETEMASARDARVSGAEQANAVWFESFPALLAFLLTDIAVGQAAKWYWEHWSYLLKYSRQEAIARVFFEHAEFVPAVISCLSARRQLQSVWTHLSSGNALVIARELVRLHGLPAITGWQPVLADQDTQSAFDVAHMFTPNQVKDWRPLFASVPHSDGRILLAGAIYGLIHAPLWLKRNPEKLLAAFTAAVMAKSTSDGKPSRTRQRVEIGEPVPVAQSISSAKVVEDFEQVANTKTSLALESGSSSGRTTTTRSSGDPTHKLVSLESKAKRDVQTEPQVVPGQLDSATPLTQTDTPELNLETGPAEEVLPSALDEEITTEYQSTDEPGFTFFTHAGGFFYLLTPLDHLLTPQLLSTQNHASGWQWLWDFHRLLTLEFPALEKLFDWPLKRFLLQQFTLAATESELKALACDLNLAAPGEFAKALFTRFCFAYQHTILWQELRQTSGFLAVPARIIATTSHLDIYLSLNSVRLDLRLAAWDINPGWLAWLGRVVTFHYIEQPLVDGEVPQ